MGKNKEWSVVRIILCILTMLMLSLSLTVPEITPDKGMVYSVIDNIKQSLNMDFFTMTVLFVAIYYANMKIDEIVKDCNWALYISNVILAIIWLISAGLSIDDSTTSLHSSLGQIIKSVIYVIGAAHLLNCIGNVLYHFFAKTQYNRCSEMKNRIRTYLTYFALVLIVWLPNTVISHPASIECDVWDSLYQYFGRTEFTAHHPPVFTVLIGWCAKIGLSLGDINIGFFMWILLQTIIAAAIMAYVLYTMCIMNTPRWMVVVTFVIAAVSPCYTSYVTTIVKDVPYSFSLLLYMVELVHIHIDWEKFWKSVYHIALFISSNIGVMLFRHNGIYVVGLMMIYLLVKCLRNSTGISRINFAKYVMLLVLPIAISEVLSNAVISHYNVTVQEGESMREALSIPFQQTARYAKYYEDETPEEEKTIIDRVIDYYALSNVYEPAISDPVKSRFHYYATREDWINYFKVWFRQFTRHPYTYFEATMNQNYYLVYPFKENSRFYYSTYVDYFYNHDFMDEMGAAQNMTFAKANDVRIEFYRLLNTLPLTGVFSNLAVYNIILAYLIIFAIKDSKREFLWITIPIVVSDLVILAGPAIYDNIRYALPVIYMMPLAVAYFLYVHDNVNVEIKLGE